MPLDKIITPAAAARRAAEKRRNDALALKQRAAARARMLQAARRRPSAADVLTPGAGLRHRAGARLRSCARIPWTANENGGRTLAVLGDQPTMQIRVVEEGPAAPVGPRHCFPRNRVHGRHRRPVTDSADHDRADRDRTANGTDHDSVVETVSDQEETWADSTVRVGVPVRHAFSRFWPMTKGDRSWLVLICVCVVLAALAETASILLFSDLTDNALRSGSLSAFWAPAGAWFAAALFGAFVGYVGNSLAVWTAERFVMRLREKVFAHVQILPPDFFGRHRTGDLVERLTGDVESIEQMVVSGAVGTVSAIFSTVFFSAAALWLRWDLALATFTLAPLFWLAARRFSGRIKTVARQERVADGAITSVVEESLGHIVLTQAYNRGRVEEKRLRREARAWMRASVTGARLSELYEQLVEVVETLCVLIVIGLGAWEISKDRMTIGQLLAFAAFLGYLYPPIRSLGQLGLTLTAATAGAERLLEILDARPAVTDPATDSVVEPSRVLGEIEFHQVAFRYPGAAKDSLSALSFTARPGELVLVTGASGAGKSTVSKLLLRFYDPAAGLVRLDGVPLDRLPVDFLRQNVALLPQETLILHDSIHENIACGRPGASDADVVQAARDADAHEFIAALPDGYGTPIGPHTAKLSGGQLQRIAIARAMLRDAPVLILDEPTTGLDAPTARRIIEPMRRLMRGRTTIMITHDLNLAPDADRVLVLDHGRLVETGTHHELLAHGGSYAHLHRSQNSTTGQLTKTRQPVGSPDHSPSKSLRRP